MGLYRTSGLAIGRRAEGSLSEILCVRHNLSSMSMYAKQDEQEETGILYAERFEAARG